MHTRALPRHTAVAKRLRRKERLTGDNPLEYHLAINEGVEKVQKARLAFEQLSKLALTPEESAAWIERTAPER